MPSRRKKGGEARARLLEAQRRRLPRFILDLANLVMVPERRLQQRPKKLSECVAQMAEDHEVVAAILKRYNLPHTVASPIAFVPCIIASYYLANLLSMVARKPHKKTPEFIYATEDAEKEVDRWYQLAVAPRFLPQEQRLLSRRQDRDAWADNLGFAQEWIEILRHVPTETLALVRECSNPRCASNFYMRRSGPESAFCSKSCRRQVTGE